MNRIFLVAAFLSITAVAACPDSGSGPGGNAGAGGQGAQGGGPAGAGSGGTAATGGAAQAGSSGAGGNRPVDGRRDTGARAPDGPLRRDMAAAASDGAAAAGTCGFSRCPAGTICCNAGCGVCGTAPCPQPPQTCGGCTTNDDCRLFDDYCTGCDCRALARSDPNPVCNGPPVQCYRQPCGLKVALCQAGRCVTVNVPL
jgi:hypothetical protein